MGCIQPYLVLGYFKTYLRGVGIDLDALRAGFIEINTADYIFQAVK
ncbi:hypothetical protein APHCRT_0557 [Anaplasma phagocytophilum str. CRT53-1]|uniref:Uncharacterized protein n=1 Tax=Anaplasma phagocytophilum str. CRT53-1 TaxID=1359157 RepID=A0A0F3Q3T7_ANAPH|nr:hypothetical protein [Anaplasma phagocytophilum]KJV86109.1 hypothetical protein APHCRT_0557 [Anaplasma phagocytophilum str. CRT53-1]